jgi:hypothetical protein
MIFYIVQAKKMQASSAQISLPQKEGTEDMVAQ